MSKILVKILQERYILNNSAWLPIQLQDYKTSLIGFYLGQVLQSLNKLQTKFRFCKIIKC